MQGLYLYGLKASPSVLLKASISFLSVGHMRGAQKPVLLKRLWEQEKEQR